MSLSSMTRTYDFVEDPNQINRRPIRTLGRVRLMNVRDIIDTNIDMEGDDTKYTLKCIWNEHKWQEHTNFSITMR